VFAGVPPAFSLINNCTESGWHDWQAACGCYAVMHSLQVVCSMLCRCSMLFATFP
jgi:hypothetical protein